LHCFVMGGLGEFCHFYRALALNFSCIELLFIVEAVPAGVQVFTRLCTAVFCPVMCIGRRRHGVQQSALCHSRTTKFPSVQHDELWPTSILVRRPSCLELTAKISATNHSYQHFQALAKNVIIRADIIRDILVNGLYKFTFLLTYLLTYFRRAINMAKLTQTSHRCHSHLTVLLISCISITIPIVA